MKKTLLLMAAAMFAASSFAQVDRTFVFTDKDGNEYPDGTTITADNLEYIMYDPEDPAQGGYLQVNSGLYVKNLTDETQGAGASVSLTELNGGVCQFCFPSTCIDSWGSNKGDAVKSSAGDIKAGEKLDFATEFFPENDGNATVVAQVNVYERTITKTEIAGIPIEKVTYKERDVTGPSITINFVASGVTAIKDLSASKPATIVARYSVDGKRLSAPQKGLNILKLSNGKTIKVVEK